MPPDDFHPPYNVPNFLFDSNYHGTIVSSNASAVFGANDFITSGYTSSIINHKMDYKHCHGLRAPAIQTVVPVSSKALNGLKSTNACTPTNVNLTLASSVFFQTDFSDTLFHRDAFWALPFYHNELFADHFMQFWHAVVQRILWDSGKMLFISLSEDRDEVSIPSFSTILERSR